MTFEPRPRDWSADRPSVIEEGSARGVSVQLDVPARMRDGVVLRANVYRPDASGRWPVLLARTPYDKNDQRQAVWCGIDPVQTARRGFMVVVQDTRGRFASDGRWEPFASERQDGYDSIEWAARLPGSNGRVGMFSASYCANAQWLAAGEGPPALAAVAPALTWADPLDGLLARGGALELGLALRWSLENAFDHLRRIESNPDLHRRRARAVADQWDRLGHDAYWHLPVHELAPQQRHGLADLGGFRALTEPETAAVSDPRTARDASQVPSHHTAGWYDIFLQGTLDNYTASTGARADARLLVGPWTHHAFSDPVGETVFGIAAHRQGVPALDAPSAIDDQLAWFRRQLTDDAAPPEAPVRIFVMGRNVWRDESTWPLDRAVAQRWYLRADGALDAADPGSREEVRAFAYDPQDPVPTVGGHGVLAPGSASGPFDQRSIEARADVLVYTSAPLQSALEVTGRVRVLLHTESTAPSTDWVARLCDVHPDGRSMNLCDGVLRVTDRAGLRAIDLWSTSNVFLPGHRVRLHVTSSSFPRWDRNLNTGDQRRPRFAVARQRVLHAADEPSYVELPVVP